MDFLSFFYMPLTMEFITKFIGINVLIVYNVEFIVFFSLVNVVLPSFFSSRNPTLYEIPRNILFSFLINRRSFYPTFFFSLC